MNNRQSTTTTNGICFGNNSANQNHSHRLNQLSSSGVRNAVRNRTMEMTLPFFRNGGGSTKSKGITTRNAIAKAIDIANDSIRNINGKTTENKPKSKNPGDCDFDEDGDDDANSTSTPLLLPPLKRSRSDSPTGVMDVHFFQEDKNSNKLDDDDDDDGFGLLPFSTLTFPDDDSEATSCHSDAFNAENHYTDAGMAHPFLEEINKAASSSSSIEPLPLLASVSRELSDLLHQYLPKTKLELYEGPMEFEDEIEDGLASGMQIQNTTMATKALPNIDANKNTNSYSKQQQQQQQQLLQCFNSNSNSIHMNMNMNAWKRNLLPDFKLATDAVIKDTSMTFGGSNLTLFPFLMGNTNFNLRYKPSSSKATAVATSSSKFQGVLNKPSKKAKKQAVKSAASNSSKERNNKNKSSYAIDKITKRGTNKKHNNGSNVSVYAARPSKKQRLQSAATTLLLDKVQLRDDVQKLTVENVVDEQTRIIEHTWDHNYNRLVKFYEANGHSNVLRSDPDKQLSGWVKRQRNNLKDQKLSASQIQKLDDLKFVWNRLEGAWYDKYDMLVAFESRHGNCEIPTKYDRSLAEWTQRQRREYRNKAPTMSLQRISKLNEIRSWNWDSKVWKNRGKKKKQSLAHNRQVHRSIQELFHQLGSSIGSAGVAKNDRPAAHAAGKSSNHAVATAAFLPNDVCSFSLI